MPRPKPKSGYKTKRKYGCPYCDKKLPRSELVEHVQDEHEMMIPEGYSAARAVYDHVNKKNYGTCMICGTKIYEWDDKLWRYKNLCTNPKCRETLKEKAKHNHLDDPEKQKIMLQGRRISGEYRFRDGGKKGYVGSYERKTLEFMDKVLHIESKDIETPGPTFTYEYDGQKHAWITDIFYIPAMLVIDVKDGGDNPNNRPMESYREKQLEKEKAIIEDGKYNYLRLTNNDFGQLMSAIADIRYGDMVNDPNKGVYINETSSPAGNVMVGSVRPNQINYIIPRSMNNVFDDADPDTYIFGSTDSDKAFMFDENGEIIIDSVLNLLEATNGGKIGDQKYRKVVFNKDKSSMAKLADKLAEERAKKKAKEKEKKRKEDLQREFANALYGRDVITTMASIYYLEDTVIEEVDPSKDPVFKMMTEIQAMSAELITRLKMKQIAESSNGIMIKSVEKAGNYMWLFETDAGYFLQCIDESYSIMSPIYKNKEDITPELIKRMDKAFEEGHAYGYNQI